MKIILAANSVSTSSTIIQASVLSKFIFRNASVLAPDRSEADREGCDANSSRRVRCFAVNML